MALTDGLTHWWDLDEESGTRYDSHGTKHLTDRNTVGSIVVGSGRAASFVAANDEQLYSTPILGPGSGVPFAFVVRYRIPESGGGGDLFTPGTTGQKLIIDETGKLTLNILHATFSWDSYVYADSAPGSWHRAVANFDGSTAYLYVDGEYVSSVAGRRKTGSSNDRLGIGNCDNIFLAGGVPLQGDIDFVGYWHERALTEEEITALESVTSYADLTGGTPEPVIHEAAAAEALSLTDGLSALASLYGARTEQAALSDALTAQAVLNAQSADALSITDATAVHAVLQAQIAESLILEDAESASAILGAERSDTLALLATQMGGNVLIESITEALTLSESLQGDISLEVAIAESLTLSDAASSQADLQATASEEISLVATHIASALLSAGVTEIVSVTSSVSASVVSTAVSLPDGRTLTVRAENRILTVAAENRILTVAAENRIKIAR